jgi:hypothetical protein
VNDFYMDFSGTFTWILVEFYLEFCINNVNETQSSSGLIVAESILL